LLATVLPWLGNTETNADANTDAHQQQRQQGKPHDLAALALALHI
jgi:hypothetical protein